MTFTPPDPSTYRIPSPARRAAVAILWLVPALLLYVALPYFGLAKLSQFGVSTGYSINFIVLAGTGLAILGAAASYARPTRWYGPLSMAASAATIGYLLVLARASTAVISVGHGGTLTLSYAGMITAFAAVPAIRLVSGLVTTIEDLFRPTERLPYDFPAPVLR